MRPIPSNPILYEINTFVWLAELEQRYGRPVALGSVPDEEWAQLAGKGVDFVWLMGVWERSPAGLAIVRQDAAAIAEFKHALPDFNMADLTGSPYSVRRYQVDPAIGGEDGLAAERQKLAAHGIRLILDYVPNHVAPDHPWTGEHPNYFIQGGPQDLAGDPSSYLPVGAHIFARGRDPYFPAWSDVLQLNAFDPGLRAASLETILSIASRCDGMRVDMAMLLINRIFAATWGPAAGALPTDEFWPTILQAAKDHYPGTIFIAETYWDTEKELIDSGFDYCYDKPLYDRLRDRDLQGLSAHLDKVQGYQRHLVRFTENHDEARAQTAFDGYAQLAALATVTLPGLRMFHEGQWEGRRARIPVLLGRRPVEKPDAAVSQFYARLVAVLSQPPIRDGHWARLTLHGEDGSPQPHGLAWMWQEAGTARIVLLNLTPRSLSVRLRLERSTACLKDVWTEERYESTSGDGVEFQVTLPALQGCILEACPAGSPTAA